MFSPVSHYWVQACLDRQSQSCSASAVSRCPVPRATCPYLSPRSSDILSMASTRGKITGAKISREQPTSSWTEDARCAPFQLSSIGGNLGGESISAMKTVRPFPWLPSQAALLAQRYSYHFSGRDFRFCVVLPQVETAARPAGNSQQTGYWSSVGLAPAPAGIFVVLWMP